MTNDLTTVEGSFQQLIDELEENLAEKGVTASFDNTTGIRGLVDEIKNIQTNGLYIESNDMTKYFRNSHQFEVMVYEDGQPVTQSSPVSIDDAWDFTKDGFRFFIRENAYIRTSKAND